jgi:hypothetical protein
MRYYKNIITGFVINLLIPVFYSSGVCAAPSGADLETACQQSLDAGFHGNEGMLCTWYVTPCDCDYGKEQKIPRVCLPETVTVETLAYEVIAGLQEQPELKTKDAELAVALILSRIYPCRD